MKILIFTLILFSVFSIKASEVIKYTKAIEYSGNIRENTLADKNLDEYQCTFRVSFDMHSVELAVTELKYSKEEASGFESFKRAREVIFNDDYDRLKENNDDIDTVGVYGKDVRIEFIEDQISSLKIDKTECSTVKATID